MLDKAARALLRFFRNKNLKYGVNSIAVTVITVAIMIALNLLIGLLDIKWDLTSNQLFTIGDESRELLSKLNKPVEITGLFDEMQISTDTRIRDALRMLDNYTKHPNVSVRYLDPDQNPSLIRDLDPNGALDLAKSNFVVRCGTKSKKLTLIDLFEFNQTYEIIGVKAEEAFSGAIQYVAADKSPIVYFMDGHDELAADTHFTVLKNYLLNNNYLVETLNMTGASAIPDDTELLVFASPQMDLNPGELDVLRDYFSVGGKAVFLFDYNEYGREFPNFNTLFETFNLAINNDKVRSDDAAAHMTDDPYFIMYGVKSSAVIPQSFLMPLSNSRSVSILKNQREWITSTPLLSTSALATSEPVDSAKEPVSGPLDIAVAVENRGGSGISKVIVMGNASFMSDSAVNIYYQFHEVGMREIFLNFLRWMLGEQETLVIAPKSFATPMLTISEEAVNRVAIGVIFILPLLIVGTGLVIYLRRRHL
jgi:hypothetical protein